MNNTLKCISFCISMAMTNFILGQADSLINRPVFSEIKTVFQHLQGYQKMSVEGLQETAAAFLNLRKTGFQCFKDCPLLSGNEKKAMRFYLQPFYKILKDEKWLGDTFLE